MTGTIGPGAQIIADRERMAARIDELEDENDYLREVYVERNRQYKALLAAQDHDLARENLRLVRARDSAVEQAKRAVKMCAELRRQLELAKSDELTRAPEAPMDYGHYQIEGTIGCAKCMGLCKC